MYLQTRYKDLSDKQIVDKILQRPHDEEAAAFLLYDRYYPLLLKVYERLSNDKSWIGDCVNELFIHLKGKDCSWHNLATFEWRSSLGCWLSGVAKNKFQEVLPKLVGNDSIKISIDDYSSDRPTVQIPDKVECAYESLHLKVLLMEAIGLLEDEDQRFVILKRLQGYGSKDIAVLLQKKWDKHGIKKFNNRQELVIPDAAYVDVRTQRAKDNLKKIISKLK